MTNRLYYTDPLLTTFDAVVAEATTQGGRCRVVLDRTAFYPSSGGQPFDTGRLGGLPVVDVVDRADGAIEHLVAGSFAPGQTVTGEVDWARRFDHMQQHTGQHILSAAFEAECRARTVSFHLGAETSTIDLHREVSAEEIARAESVASGVVWEDRPVSVRFVSDAEAAGLPLRKDPTRTGELRLVEVADFDLSACGGTHVPSTGRIGVIAVSGSERFKGGSRVAFVCGGRALSSHRRLRDIVADAARTLSVSGDDVPATVERLLADAREHVKNVKQLHEALATSQAVEIRGLAETIGRHRVVLTHRPDADAHTLRVLASAVVAGSGLVAVVVGAGSPASIVVTRSADVEFDAGRWMRRATEALGGRGGGKPALAQGGLAAEPERILDFARKSLSDAS